jgi:AbrB family looped-hinge helix DNA binding protein
MATATVTSKGQVTIPLEVRNRLGIKAGTRLEFVERADGTYELFAATGSVRDLAGMFTRSGPPISVEQMDEAIGDAIVERYKRSL